MSSFQLEIEKMFSYSELESPNVFNYTYMLSLPQSLVSFVYYRKAWISLFHSFVNYRKARSSFCYYRKARLAFTAKLG